MSSDLKVGDQVRYGQQGSVAWRVTKLHPEEGKVSIELVRNPAIFRYRVPAVLLRPFRRR